VDAPSRRRQSAPRWWCCMTSPSGEGMHGESCDHWDRLGKAGLPSPCGVEGRPVLRKKVSRAQLLGLLAKQPPAVVAMEACATAHEWGRAISGLGHDVRRVAPIYVKPFVRRQQNDAADAEAIAEAASRPTMRFVALKTEEQQGAIDDLSDPRPLGAAANPVGQRAARPCGGAWDCRRPRARQSESAGDCAARHRLAPSARVRA